MKKIFLFSFILIVTMGMVYSAEINVTSPAAGVTWYKGSTHNITWSGAGCGNPNVKINIFKSPISQANFTGVQLTATLASHSKSWTVPGSFANGSYIIRVKSADSACYGDSGVFTITDPPVTSGSLTITNPHAGTIWYKGARNNITWRSSGSLSANLKINIFKGSITPANFVTQLIASTTSGSKSWVIPSNAETGTYFIRIKEDPAGNYWDSSPFEIKKLYFFVPPLVESVGRVAVYDLLFEGSIRRSLVFKRLYFKGGKDYRVEFDMKVKNTHTQSLRNIKITWYIQEIGGSTIPLRGLNIGSPFTIERIGAGETYTKHFNLVFGKSGRRNANYPRIKKGKRYTIVLVIDQENKFAETNERNNTTRLTFGPVPR